MDYGKLAYIKAEELEKRLVKTNTARITCSDYTASPTFDFSTGKSYGISAISANGTITVMAVMTVQGNGANGQLKLYLGEDLLSSQQVVITSDESQTVIFTRAINLYEEKILSVKGEGLNATLKSVQVVLIGEKADMRTNLNSSAVDKLNQTWMLIDCKNDRVRIFPFSENDFNLNTEVFVGGGKACDICAGAEGFIVAYIDDAGNTVLAKVSTTNLVTDYTVCGTGASACAICKNLDKYILCEIIDGKVYYSKVEPDLSCSDRSEVPTPFKIDGISFVKNSSTPMLVLYSDGRSYLKIYQVTVEKAESVKVSISLSIN